MTTYVYGDRRIQIVLNGEKISTIRRDLGMTQVELATKAKVSRSTIERIEETTEGGAPVHTRTWRNISKALGLRSEGAMNDIRIFEEYLFEGTDAEGQYVRDPLTLEMQYERMRREDES